MWIDYYLSVTYSYQKMELKKYRLSTSDKKAIKSLIPLFLIIFRRREKHRNWQVIHQQPEILYSWYSIRNIRLPSITPIKEIKKPDMKKLKFSYPVTLQGSFILLKNGRWFLSWMFPRGLVLSMGKTADWDCQDSDLFRGISLTCRWKVFLHNLY